MKTRAQIMAKANIRRYGITTQTYEEIYDEQGGVCAICKQPETTTRNNKVRRLCIDHDHETDLVRGLLCSRCNSAIALLQDDPSIVQAAKEYLETNVGLLEV